MGCASYRYVFALMACCGMAIIYGMKVNLSVAVVAMVNHTALAELASLEESSHHMVSHGHGVNVTDLSDEVDDLVCTSHVTGNGTEGQPKNEDGPFTWTEPQQGLILGSYFWGYFITQIPGGRLAELTSAKWVFFVATLMNVIGCAVSPLVSHISPYALVACRVVQGLGGGVTFPAMNVLISKWAPSDERSSITAIVLGGCSLGTVISIPSSGLIAGLARWEYIFYIHGGLSCIWLVLWAVLVTDTPSENRFVSQKEAEHIEQSQNNSNKIEDKKKLRVPWRQILTSVPVWAIILSHTLNNVGWYMLLVELPLFMRTGLGLSIGENAALVSLPFLCNWFFSIFYGNRIDWARRKGYLSTTWARKISVVTSSVLPAVCLVGVCLSGCEKSLVILFMVVATTFYGAMYSGFFSNHVDIASNYAGVLMGMSNMAATIPGFIIPALVGYLTHGVPGLGPWHLLFYGTSALLVVECIIFVLLGTSVEQEWNISKAHTAVKTDSDVELENKN